MNMFTVLTVILVVLKLLGMITISWAQVFIPLYILLGLLILHWILMSLK